jgi:TMEM175 potassium channel family protein
MSLTIFWPRESPHWVTLRSSNLIASDNVENTLHLVKGSEDPRPTEWGGVVRVSGKGIGGKMARHLNDEASESVAAGGQGRPDIVGERLRSPDRVVFLSDGVFAIVMTILVLEIKVPHDLSHESFRRALEELRPTLVAWIISFLITGMFWVAHRDIFARVRSVNRDLVWLNLLFLLPTALLPFAASLLGEYPDDRVALQLYGIVAIAVSVMRLVVYWYVVRHPKLLWPQSSERRLEEGFLLAALPIGIYLIAVGIAFASPTASILLLFSVPVIYFLAVTIARERGGSTSEADEFS